jgi:hypothetical protein
LRERDIDAPQELEKMRRFADRPGMKVMTKDEPASWSNRSTSSVAPSDLDQVVAADHMTFRAFIGAEVQVNGWPKEPTAASQDEWITRYSDHGCLYLEVQKP